jgi:hypothetical protein
MIGSPLSVQEWRSDKVNMSSLLTKCTLQTQLAATPFRVISSSFVFLHSNITWFFLQSTGASFEEKKETNFFWSACDKIFSESFILRVLRIQLCLLSCLLLKIVLHAIWRYSTRIIFLTKRQSYPCKRPFRPIGLWNVEAPTSSRQSAQRWRWGWQPYVLAALYPQEDSWYWFILEAELTPGP